MRKKTLTLLTLAIATASVHSEPRPLGLAPTELRQLEAFLRTLSGPLEVDGHAAPGPAS